MGSAVARAEAKSAGGRGFTSDGIGMTTIKVDELYGLGKRNDGVALLNSGRTDEAQFSDHAIEFTLRAFESRYLSSRLKLTGHAWHLFPSSRSQLLGLRRKCCGAVPDEISGCLTQESHNRDVFVAGYFGKHSPLRAFESRYLSSRLKLTGHAWHLFPSSRSQLLERDA